MGKSKGKKGLTAQSSDVLQASEPPKIKSKRRKPHASAGVITLSSIATLVAAIGATYFLTSQAALPEQPVVAKQQREEIPLVQKTKQQPTGSAKKTKRERTVESQRAGDDPSCAGWVEDGECESNPKLMRKLCPIACAGRLSDDDPALGEEKVKKMKGVAADTEENCAWWASAGECEKNPVFMLSSCATSCAHAASETGASRDTHQDCSAWVKDGECYRNPAFMLQQCKASCEKFAEQNQGILQDTSDTCVNFALQGGCDTDLHKATTVCRASCHIQRICANHTENVLCAKALRCEALMDKEASCAAKAARGLCESNPTHMLKNCLKACSENDL